MKTLRLTPSIALLLFITAGTFCLSGTAGARSINDGIGRTSFAWLKSISDAGITATGECLSTRDGASGLLVHPAAVTGIERGTAKLSYVSHYIDTQYGSVGYAGKLRDRYVGLRVMYLNYGEFNGRDINNEPTGTFTAGDMGLTLNVGKQLRDDLKVGVMVSYLTSKIEDYTAQVVTLDIGAIYYPPFKGFTVGAVLMNMGKMIKGYSSGYEETLPVYLAVGVRKKLDHAPFTLFSDIIFPNDNDIAYAYGVEASVRDVLFLRAGTKSRGKINAVKQKTTTDFSAIPTFGFGVELDRYRFNYAYCPDDTLEDIHKITISTKIK